MPPGGAILASAASVRIVSRKPSLTAAIGNTVRWDLNSTELLQSPSSSPKEERREVLSPIAGQTPRSVRRMLLKPELPINPREPVDRAIETTMDALVGLAPEATTAKAARESASAAAPKTKLKGFSFGGSSKGKKGDAFQEWKRSKPEKLADSSASSADGLVPASELKPKAAVTTELADSVAAGPSLPLSLMDAGQARQSEEAKTARRTFGTPAPGPIMMPFV